MLQLIAARSARANGAPIVPVLALGRVILAVLGSEPYTGFRFGARLCLGWSVCHLSASTHNLGRAPVPCQGRISNYRGSSENPFFDHARRGTVEFSRSSLGFVVALPGGASIDYDRSGLLLGRKPLRVSIRWLCLCRGDSILDPKHTSKVGCALTSVKGNLKLSRPFPSSIRAHQGEPQTTRTRTPHQDAPSRPRHAPPMGTRP